MTKDNFKPASKKLVQKYKTTSKKLLRRYGFPLKKFQNCSLQGAYYDPALLYTEFLLHELSHVLAFGFSLNDIPKDLSNKIDEQLEHYSKSVCDHMEIDAASITFLTGRKLRLWNDPHKILTSCRNNLSEMRYSSEFETYFRNKINFDKLIEINSNKLYTWFRQQNKKYNDNKNAKPGR